MKTDMCEWGTLKAVWFGCYLNVEVRGVEVGKKTGIPWGSKDTAEK